ncbi:MULTISPECIES: hypothetical protein [Rhodopseudomonas]|uniref:Uncharacterized protein n=1 Tax=Rhodopseudomonas palustris TaxID=1076 RepID=A0A0D7F3Q0_RHOPL|nr:MULTISPECIES: hypothetical protein [Rhodopseudomonas]KIZ47684.1 hypothetical protein OO17_02980 [Rhodopseudomonas palustris]MDF3811878.1 hypothetical protein [Rhodopseudomonas sp. BAL398]WOK16644.1 hypothetical protein RBJ75_21215 [Rhodopseudomonas sp. BAL398]
MSCYYEVVRRGGHHIGCKGQSKFRQNPPRGITRPIKQVIGSMPPPQGDPPPTVLVIAEAFPHHAEQQQWQHPMPGSDARMRCACDNGEAL